MSPCDLLAVLLVLLWGALVAALFAYMDLRERLDVITRQDGLIFLPDPAGGKDGGRD